MKLRDEEEFERGWLKKKTKKKKRVIKIVGKTGVVNATKKLLKHKKSKECTNK